jgi:transposase
MAKALLPDDLWAMIEPLLPVHRPSPKGGRPRIDDRAALTGILFVLKTGLPWEYLPRELSCGSGMSCWRRLHAWQQTGVWQPVHDAMLQHLREYEQIQWERASVDSASVPSPLGGQHTGPNPTDRGKLGCKHHLLVDQRGLPLVASISGAQVHDSRMLIPLLEAVPSVAGLAGWPRKRLNRIAWVLMCNFYIRLLRYNIKSRVSPAILARFKSLDCLSLSIFIQWPADIRSRGECRRLATQNLKRLNLLQGD